MFLDDKEITKIFIRFSEEAINLLAKRKKKRKTAFIRPAAYFELNDNLYMPVTEWSLTMQLIGEKQIDITDREGRLILKKVKTLIK